jgi:signal transduction histidine kinase
VVAYTMVEQMQWGLLIEEPWEQVASPVLQTTHLAPLAMVPVLLISMFALLFAYRQVIRPLQFLAKQASSLGWGDYSAIERSVGGIDEIRYLQLELIHMAHKVRAAQRNLHSYIGAITSGQEEERRRLARELHDETIQSLISFKQHIQLVEMDYADQPVAQALVKLEDVAEKTIENVRRIVRALRPIYLEDLGLVAALHMLVNEMGQTSDISITFERLGKERRLNSEVELALYRIVQEALSNIARHSEATLASVILSFVPKGIQIIIKDNGKGFPVPNSPAEFAPGGHFGWLGMHERAELIGGNMQVQSAAGEGTQLTVEVTTPV